MTALRRISLPVCTALLLALAGTGTAEAKTKNCGSFTKNGAHVTVYRVKGHVSCKTARRVAHRAIGASCSGEKLKGGWKCTHGAPAIGASSANGFTLRKGRKNVQGKVG